MKFNGKKRILSVLLSALLLSQLAACGSSGLPSGSSGTPSAGTPSPSPSSGASEEAFAGYPIKTDKTLKIWSFSNRPASEYTDPSQSPFHKGLIEKTGVNLEWEWPVPGADNSQSFNLMLASGDLPDVIFYYLNGQQLIDDGYILSLNEVIDKYAPNLTAYYAQHPEMEKDLKTDQGNFYHFPWLRGSDFLRTYLGPVVRKDWLSEQGLEIPQTIDEWTTTLKKFKESYGATFAVANANNRMWQMGPWVAYGVMKDYYIDEGKIVYGPSLPEYRDALATMHQWYKDGLIDPDFATLDDAGMQTKVLNNKVGFSFTASSQITNWTQAITAGQGMGEWTAAPYPVINKGDSPEFVQMDGNPFNLGAAITTSCKDVELAARFLDYGYTEEGRMYWNFGTEGESYNLVNGEPVYTDAVLNYPEGINKALDKYIGTQGAGMSIQDERMWRQKNLAVAAEGVEIWTSDNLMKTHALPVITPTTEETNELSALENAIKTYMEEMYYKFLYGEESLDNFDKYVDTLYSMKLDRVLEIKQAQLERYNNR